MKCLRSTLAGRHLRPAVLAAWRPGKARPDVRRRHRTIRRRRPAALAGRQAVVVHDRQGGLESESPDRPHLSHQRRRHRTGAADVRRARRIEPALVAGRQVDRVHDAPRRRRQQSDLPAECRGRRSAPPHQPSNRAGHADVGAGRQVDLLRRRGCQVGRRARARSPVRRCVCVRGEQFQAAAHLDDGSRGQDDARDRGRLERQRLRAERGWQTDRDAAQHQPAARIPRPHRSVGDGCERIECQAADQQPGSGRQRLALAGWLHRAVHLGSHRTRRDLLQRQVVPGACRRRPGEDPAAERGLRRRERVVEQGRQDDLLHREHGHAQRNHARERRDAGRPRS